MDKVDNNPHLVQRHKSDDALGVCRHKYSEYVLLFQTELTVEKRGKCFHICNKFAAAVVFAGVRKNGIIAILRAVANKILPAGNINRRILSGLCGNRDFKHNSDSFIFSILELFAWNP